MIFLFMPSLKLPEGYPEILGVIASGVYIELAERGHKPSASDIALACAERVRKVLGGGDLYLPNGRYWEASLRANKIRASFNGRNYRELAREFGITEMRVRQIIDGKNGKRSK